LALVIEVDLYDLVVKAEEDALVRLHPLLNVHERHSPALLTTLLVAALQVLAEVLHQGQLFVQLFILDIAAHCERHQFLAILLVADVIDLSA
jgi:hypothetical protein